LVVGNTFTVEPGIYIPGVGGVRIEDEVLLTDTGPESLTTYARELTVIG
jgi:Xaa-Pro dipeptidase